MRKPPADLVALTDAVKESPEDDAPRLVVADWLDEHGDEAERAWAELIRVQCEILRGLAEAACPEAPGALHELLRGAEHHIGAMKHLFSFLFRTEPRLAALVKRDDELIKQWSARWLAPLEDGAWCQWHRGTGTLRRGRPYRSRELNELSGGLGGHLIEGLWIDTVPSTVAVVARCRLLDQVIALDVEGREELGGEALAAILSSPRLRGLRRLAFSGGTTGAAAVSALPRAPRLDRLTHLALPGGVPVASARELAACALPALTSFRIRRDRELGEEGAAALGEAPFLAGLSELALSECRLPAGGLVRLFAGPHFRCPRALDLRGNRLAGPGVGALLAAPGLEEVMTLNLSNNGLGDEAVAELAASPRLAGLVALQLGSNGGLGPAGAGALAASPHLGRLVTLDLTACHLGDEGVMALVRSSRLPRLRKLLADQARLSEATKRALRERFGG